MADATYVLCPGCVQWVDTSAPETIYAIRLAPMATIGGAQRVTGRGAYFHDRRCFAAAEGEYREMPKRSASGQTAPASGVEG